MTALPEAAHVPPQRRRVKSGGGTAGVPGDDPEQDQYTRALGSMYWISLVIV
jgi:hypothetical protein